MKKVFRILEEACLIASIVILFIGALISMMPVTTSTGPGMMNAFGGMGGPGFSMGSVILSSAVIIVVGVFMKHTENKISNRIGEGLLLAGYLVVGITTIGVLMNSVTVDTATVITLVAVIIYAVSYLFRFINYIIDRVLKEKDQETQPEEK